ncbi:hypothetical protein NIE88_03825 [Sporolactobacillus shoreicorticis]|uniref:Uncharacterized protein n=1 Tax=Sporolactobacillus shoreicorticis TaxID=1923877 RepID=A0ABW5RX54_9BACL|nr:hypothetical protein [Sporolactobacillus shoreicorticis]MCO7124904.1 hypothetical protein [Sporolactobacillus shoreicorticis]
MISYLLFCSYLPLLLLFLISVLLRWNTTSYVFLYILSSWTFTIPLLVLFLEQKKHEPERMQSPQRKGKA